MRMILAALGITQGDVARRAKISAAAVSASLKRRGGLGYETAKMMVLEAKFDGAARLRVGAALEELKNFLEL